MKLRGPSNYMSWRRSIEISLVAKQKLDFVTTIARREDQADETKKDQWDTCNHVVMAWISKSVNDSIKLSMTFIEIAREIWQQLETRFSKVNEAQKYKLNREHRLFQFLNCLDQDYAWKRSQFLIGSTLPTVESVCVALQQEEAQSEI
ncbi:Conidial yellow pigment biosynthesis polyketide synthase [Bienertia sinuspersici]